MRRAVRLSLPVLAGSLLLATLPTDMTGQSLPARVRVDLERAGHRDLAEDLADRLGRRSAVDRGQVEDLLERWSEASGGPERGLDWLSVARLWLKAGEPGAAREALDRAEAGGVPGGTIALDRARIGFLAGDTETAAEHYWRACSAANEASALEAWRDVEMLATPDEVERWDRFRRLPASQRDDCGFFRAFWNERAARSAMPVDERLEAHYARLRFAMDHYTRRGKAQDVSASGKLNARLGRTGAPRFDDRGLLFLRLGPPDETASMLGGDCHNPNVTWFYRFPDGNRMYHLSPLGGNDNWWLLSNLGEIFRCPVRGDGSIDRTRSPMIALPNVLDRLPPYILREIYSSRAQLDPEYARMAYRFDEFENVEVLQDERDLTWADGQYAVTEIPERPDVRMDVGLVHEWVAFRLPMPERTRMWLFLAVDGEELRDVDPRPEEGLEVVVTALDRDGRQERTTGRLDIPEPGSDVVVRLPFDLPPGEYETKVVVRAGPPRAPGEEDREPPSGGFTTGILNVPELSTTLPRLSGIAVSPDSGGSWAQTDAVALSPQPIHLTNPDGRMWIYFEAYNLTPGGRYTADVVLEPEDGDGPPFDLEFTGVARPGGRVVTPSGLRLDLADASSGLYRLTLTVRDLATGRVTLPSRTEIRILERDESRVANGAAGTGD
ncbi:MAG: hypothetical protein ACODAA_01195 [Gemmatimonadota bacterium]